MHAAKLIGFSPVSVTAVLSSGSARKVAALSGMAQLQAATWSKASNLQGGQTQIADLDFSTVSVDVYLVTAQISVHNWRFFAMQIIQPKQDLSRPLPHCF